MDAKRRDEWDRFSFGLVHVLNAMPNFSDKKRAPVRMEDVNPFHEREGRRSGLSDDAMEAALDAIAMRGKQ